MGKGNRHIDKIKSLNHQLAYDGVDVGVFGEWWLVSGGFQTETREASVRLRWCFPIGKYSMLMQPKCQWQRQR